MWLWEQYKGQGTDLRLDGFKHGDVHQRDLALQQKRRGVRKPTGNSRYFESTRSSNTLLKVTLNPFNKSQDRIK